MLILQGKNAGLYYIILSPWAHAFDWWMKPNYCITLYTHIIYVYVYIPTYKNFGDSNILKSKSKQPHAHK